MKPFCASILPLLVTFVLACSNTQSPTSTAKPASASFAGAPSGIASVVTRTDEGDSGADGTVDSRVVVTTWYDAHGNPTKVVYERMLPAEDAVRATTVYEYTVRGALFGYVIETDNGADGTIDRRSTLQTVETDNRGNPTTQEYVYSDLNAPVDILNEFDTRGRVVHSVQGPVTTRYAYDPHDNVIFYESEISQGGGVHTITIDYNVHDAFVSEKAVLSLNGLTQDVYVVSTTAYDSKGYPVQQLIEGNFFAGSRQRETSTITYDSHHNKLTQVSDVDYDGDGSVDSRGTSHWTYQGRNDLSIRNANVMAMAPAGGRFTR
jgi:hypothetical protein